MSRSSILKLALAFVVGLWVAACASPQAGANVWFDDLQASSPLTAAEGEAVAGFVADAVLGGQAGVGAAPDALRSDPSPRIVFVSVSDGDSPAVVAMGAGESMAEAVEQAIDGVREALPGGGYRPRWVKFDIVQEVHVLSDVDPTQPQPPEYERSLYGLAFDRSSGLAFLPEELVSRTLIDSDQDFRFANMEAYLGLHSRPTSALRRLEEAERLTVYRFSTLSFFSDGEELVRLYRGHRLISQPSPDDLLAAAVAGGRYLVHEVDEEGRFVYIYWPKSDSVADDYSILRHAGTVYAMLELYEVTGQEELLQAAERALDYLLLSSVPCQVGSEVLMCLLEDGAVKLGGNGLAAVALAKYIQVTGDRRYMPALLELGRWIQAVQAEDGEFLVHRQSYPDGEVADFVSEYYPGEALLAMTRIHALNPGGTWLDTAEKGAQYLINVRDGGLTLDELPHDHWLLYALNELYRYRPDPLYKERALLIAQAIVQSQNRSPEYEDWLGSYYRPPRSTPTATRSEGLFSAYQLARDFGSPQEAQAILEALRLGAAFQLQTQFRPESVMYLDDPQRSLGGFHRSLTNYEIRIDYVQHNLSSLLGLYRLESSPEQSSQQ